MSRNRLLLLALTVAALLAVVALVAHGRPLASAAGRTGNGLPDYFWDYVVTTMVIIVVLSWIGVLVTALNVRRDPQKKLPPAWSRTLMPLVSMLFIALVLALAWTRLHHLLHPRHPGDPLLGGTRGGGHHGTQNGDTGRPAHLRWDEVAIIGGLLLAAVALGVAVAVENRRRRSRRPLPSIGAPEAVAAALDLSLDDLRSDPDLRRAIVAAYARMETALARAGVPRRPAEAPLEYLARSLIELDVDGPAVRRLTELFEWARFSHHEPEPSMRDEAVDALEAIRDSLLAPARVAA